MKLSSDEHFHIGSLHARTGKPCQDYALSGAYGGAVFAIVSDGCTSGGRTDIGARLCALTAASAIREHRASGAAAEAAAAGEIQLRQQVLLSGTRHLLELSAHDMEATCVYAYLTPQGGFIHVLGDGVVAFVHTDGSAELRRFDWANNMPFYPIYAEDHAALFQRAHAADANNALTQQYWLREIGGEYEALGAEQFSVAEGIRGIVIPLSADELQRLAYVAVFTDGVTQVREMEWQTAADALLAFRSAEGEFAKRRMKAFIRDCEKSGKTFSDDLAYAVIRVTNENADQTKEDDDGASQQ